MMWEAEQGTGEILSHPLNFAMNLEALKAVLKKEQERS